MVFFRDTAYRLGMGSIAAVFFVAVLANSASTLIGAGVGAAGSAAAADRTYLADLVADQTGVPGAEAQRKVDDRMAAASRRLP